MNIQDNGLGKFLFDYMKEHENINRITIERQEEGKCTIEVSFNEFDPEQILTP